MPAPSPEDFLEQADHLLSYRRPRHPRQADLRRAVSAAYYGLFHLICTDAGWLFAGNNPTRSLVYRSLDHGQLRRTCVTVQASKLDDAMARMLSPSGRFMRELVDFAAITVQLQDARHRADYDPDVTYAIADARARIQSARSALDLYKAVQDARPAIDQRVFLSLLMFKKRA